MSDLTVTRIMKNECCNILSLPLLKFKLKAVLSNVSTVCAYLLPILCVCVCVCTYFQCLFNLLVVQELAVEEEPPENVACYKGVFYNYFSIGPC